MNRYISFSGLLLTTLLLVPGCNKPSGSSKLAAVPADPETTVIKVPTPDDLLNIAGPFMPVIKSRDYQNVQKPAIGFRILCSNVNERNLLLQGLGINPSDFDKAEPAYMDVDAPPPAIQALHLDSHPLLRCPGDQASSVEKPRLLQSLSNPPLFYLNYTNSPVAGRENTFYELGCEGLIAGLGLNRDTALPINFALDRPNANKVDINCPNGTPPTFNPFLAECEAAVRAVNPTSDQAAYQTLLSSMKDFTGKSCSDLWNFAKGMTDFAMPSEVLESVKPLEYMTNLRTIDVHDNLIASIEPLGKLTRLRTLDISENPDLNDISALAGLKALTTIKATKTKIRDLTPLSRLTKLNTIEFELKNLDPAKCPIVDVESEALLNYCKAINVSDFVKACEDDAKTGGSPKNIFLALKTQFNKTTCFELFEAVKNTSSLTLVNQPELADISSLQYLTQLQELDLRGNKIISVSPLSKLTRLQKLNLSSNLIKDISPLQGLGQLVQLNLAQNQIIDGRPLAQLPVFQGDLSLQGNPLQLLPAFKDWCRLTISTEVSTAVSKIKDKAGVDLCTADELALANLTSIKLDNSGLKTLAPLGTLPIEKLSARYNDISAIDFLTTLPKLTVLDLSFNKITSVASLSNLTALKEVYLNGNLIDSLAPLRRLDQLEKLDLAYNKLALKREDIEGGFPKLRWLDVSFNALNDVAALAHFPAVEQLYIRSTGITNPAGLEFLPLVRHLDVSQNTLSGSSVFGEIINLESLIAESCSLDDITSFSALGNLSVIDLSGNKLKSASIMSQDPDFTARIKFLDLRDNALNGECPLPKAVCYK